MPSVSHIIRRRALARSKGKTLGVLAFLTVGIITSVVILLASLGFFAGLAYTRVIADLPPVKNLEEIFSNSADGFIQPIQVYDRSGENLLFELIHPDAMARHWVSIHEGGENQLPEEATQAAVAFLDDDFWSDKGYKPTSLIANILSLMGDESDQLYSRSIEQRLLETTIIPPEEYFKSSITRFIGGAVLAQRLNDQYSKEQILEWYLNTANYGNMAFGIDAAALVYFGKHAEELTLAESSMLVAIPDDPEINPFDTPAEARIRQGLVLTSMAQDGMIDDEEVYLILSEPLGLANNDHLDRVGAQKYLMRQLSRFMSSGIFGQPDLRVLTTIDYELQLQSECAANAHLERLAGALISSEALDYCASASFLPPMRPGDVGVDHLVDQASFVILDPKTGEILAMNGAVNFAQRAETILYPFVYLSAFTRGYSPGTMVLDLPPDGGELDSDHEVLEAHGPSLIREALVGGYPFAAQRIAQSMGAETLLNVLIQMNVLDENVDLRDGWLELEMGLEVNLVDLVSAYGVMANEGRMEGVDWTTGGSETNHATLEPVLIATVINETGEVLYQASLEERIVLSPQLAYLVTDVLSDPVARWPHYGRPNLLDVERPAAVMVGTTSDETSDWTVGYTPLRVVGVRLSGRGGQAMQDIGPLNGSAALWHTLMRFASVDLPMEAWEIPLGITSLEVCDPSGGLPTEHCPIVKTEIFLEGTEPIQYDTLYRPVKVNKETGNLATMFTPFELIEERIYLIPPPEAVRWARSAGFAQPPFEYDRLIEPALAHDSVRIEKPEAFSYLRDLVAISGVANAQDFEYYRLLYGKGLYPDSWVQIGEDRYQPVYNGFLESWETAGLDGLYTIQLMVVTRDGEAFSAFMNVTVDNEDPEIEISAPEEQTVFSLKEASEILVKVEVEDNVGIARVDYYLDGKKVNVSEDLPFWATVTAESAGRHEIYTWAYDLAGNAAESEMVLIYVR